MRASDNPRPAPGDITLALALLTRLPLRLGPGAWARSAASAWAWPLVGLGLALAAWLLASTAQAIGISYEISCLLALTLLIVSTGALHEDGLADAADGLWGGFTRARRLEIMKDSRIGAYGVLALILSLALRAMALISLEQSLLAGLIAAAMLSRAAMVHVMAALPNARGEGLSQLAGRPAAATARLAAGLACIGALLVAGWAGLWAIAAALAAILACIAIARAKLGGQTGDILGASQQIVEIAVLLALSAAL